MSQSLAKIAKNAKSAKSAQMLFPCSNTSCRCRPSSVTTTRRNTRPSTCRIFLCCRSRCWRSSAKTDWVSRVSTAHLNVTAVIVTQNPFPRCNCQTLRLLGDILMDLRCISWTAKKNLKCRG